ncbi:MAG: response regulator [Planctomycetales bacterium]|nr:response regulator [Planctomycetales bacterium]
MPPGTRVRIRGTTDANLNHTGNLIRLEELTVIESDSTQDTMVAPVELDFDKVAADVASWVVAEVEVHSILTDMKSTTIRASYGDRPLSVILPPLMDPTELVRFVGARLRVTGNLQHQVVVATEPEFSIACPEGYFKVASEAESPLTYDESVQTISEVWSGNLSYFHIGGIVTLSTSHWFFVQNETAGTFLHNRDALPLSPGDTVKIAGSIERLPGGGANLICKFVSRFGSGRMPDPLETDVSQITGANSDALRLKVRGTYDHYETSGSPDRVFLRSKGRVFEIHLWDQPLDSLQLETARIIEATGTCSVYGSTESDFIIHAPSLDDVQVVQRVSFWTPLKICVVICFSIASVVGAVYFRTLQTRLSKNRQDLADVNARLQLVSATVRDGIPIADEDGHVIHQNQRAADILGFAIETGQSIRVVQHQIGTQDVNWDELNESRSAKGELSLHMGPTEGGSPKSLELFTAPIVDAHGRFLARLWAIYDMTEKQMMLQSLAEAEKMQAIGRVTGGVAHDFNNLLTAIKANLQVAQLSPALTDGRVHGLLASALEATDRAAELVSQLLSYSRKTPLKLQAHNINQLVKRVTHLVTPSLSDGQRISVSLADDLPPANVDDGQLEQAVLNLCLNATDAIGDGGEIVVSTYLERTTNGDDVVISVRDTGCGMDSETLEHVFEPFFTTKQKGSGLGLAMVQGTVEQHGGWIQCDSELGKGSEFCIYLPAEYVNAAHSPKKDSVDGARELDGRRVLVVDDELMVLRAVEALLQSKGATVHTASSGEQAIECLERDPSSVDLVLLDWSMPGMHGRDVLLQIKQAYPQLMTVVCTGNASEVKNVERDYGVAPDDILQKQFTVSQVSEALRAHSVTSK